VKAKTSMSLERIICFFISIRKSAIHVKERVEIFQPRLFRKESASLRTKVNYS